MAYFHPTHPVLITAVDLRVFLNINTAVADAARIGGLLMQHLAAIGASCGGTRIELCENEAGRGVGAVELRGVGLSFSKPDDLERVIESIVDFMASLDAPNRGT